MVLGPKSAVAVIMVAVVLLPATFACNGWKFKLHKLTQCKGSILKFHDDFNITLTKNCTLKPKGCIESMSAFKSAKVSYDISKSMLMGKKESNVDACNSMKTMDEKAKMMLGMVGLPTECPMPKEKKCISNGVDISEHKDKMGLLEGNWKGEVLIDHGKTGKSCINFQGSFLRRKQKG